MGITYINGSVIGPKDKKKRVRFLVDSGAAYSVLPEPVWRALGLSPMRRESFELADGTTIDRDVSDCRISIPQGQGTTPVVLGEPGDTALLGVVTLENLGLVLNPFNRTLQPMRMTLTTTRRLPQLSQVL